MQHVTPTQAGPSRKKVIFALEKWKAKFVKTFGRRRKDRTSSAHQPVDRHRDIQLVESERRKRFNECRQRHHRRQPSVPLPLSKSLVDQSPAGIAAYYKVLDWLETLE